MKVTDDGFLSVAFDASGRLVAAGGGDRAGAGLARGRSAPGLSSAVRAHGPVTGAASTRAGSLLATSALFGGSRLWDPDRASATATSWSRARGPAPDRPFDLPFLGLGTRSARMACSSPSPESSRARCCGTSTGRLAAGRLRVVGRNLWREEWELYLPSGTPYRATCSNWPVP